MPRLGHVIDFHVMLRFPSFLKSSDTSFDSAVATSTARRRVARTATALLALVAIVPIAWTLNCGGGGGGDTQPGTDSNVEDATTETDNDAGSDGGTDSDAVIPTDTGKADTGTDTSPPPVTCTKAPTFTSPLKLNHNPDALRQVANGSVAMLPDGKLMVVFLEALDSGSRYGLYSRIVDPVPDGGKFGADERLDVDADNLTAGSALTLGRLGNGALTLQYSPGGGPKRARIYSHGKWSPEVGGAMPIVDSDALTATDAPNGQVLVTRAHTSTPSATAVVYRPDEGGAFGSWSSVQTLDLDGGSGVPTVQGFALPDGRFYVSVWHGGGGPSIRVRTASGAWSVPSLKSEIGAADASPALRKMDDGTLVLVALEGTGDTRRAVTSTWNPADSTWTTARLLSKTTDANGVVPFVGGRADPFLFRVSDSELEFVAWVAGCTGASKDCEFHPISRRYKSGAWTDPVDLAIGSPVNGADGLSVVAVDGSTPLVQRTSSDTTSAQLRARIGAVASFAPVVSLFDSSPLFSATTHTNTNFFGGSLGLWSIAGRTNVPTSGPTTTIASAIGKIDPAATPPTNWGAVIDTASAEMRGLSYVGAYLDGTGSFTVAIPDAVDGGSRVALLAHATSTGGALDVQRVQLSDETGASFANVPRFPARLGGVDKSAIFTVLATPSGAGTGKRLRAYAWNGVGSVTPRLLANETRSAHPFGEGLLTYGCGGAILYAVDPADGSHGLEMVLVQ